MTDELIARGYCAEVDWDCELSAFMSALGRIKGFDMIQAAAASAAAEFAKSGSAEERIKQLNTALGGRAFIWRLPVNLDSCPLAILDPAAYNEIING